jgi:hypothetical protein
MGFVMKTFFSRLFGRGSDQGGRGRARQRRDPLSLPPLARLPHSAEDMITYLDRLADPALFGGAEQMIRNRFGLYPYYGRVDDWGAQALLDWRQLRLGQMRENPECALAWTCSGDGHLREAALAQTIGPRSRSVEIYLIYARLNDWVPQVRQAAEAAVLRCLPATPDHVLFLAFWELVDRARLWQRTTGLHERIVGDLIARPAVFAQCLAGISKGQRPGRFQVFRGLCHRPEIDKHLPDLARDARDPMVRAVALRSLGTGRISWPTGDRERVWIDKPMGLYRMQTRVAHRPVSVFCKVDDLIAQGVADRAAVVRAAALDVAIHHRHDPGIAKAMPRRITALSGEKSALNRPDGRGRHIAIT